MLNQRAYALLNIKAVDRDQRIIEGIASTPTPDRGGDVMVPGGAKFVLPVPFLWFHNAQDPIGEVFSADVRPDGIHIKAKIATVTHPGRLKDLVDDAWAAFTASPMLVRGLSIGWGELESAPIKGTAFRRISKWIWGELSAVTVPMNTDCTISAVKQFDVGAPVASDPRSVSLPAGVTASPVKRMHMTIAEHVAALEVKRDATADRMKAYIQKQATDGMSLTETEEEDYAGLKKELLATDRDIALAKDAETLNLEKLQPVVASTPTTVALPTRLPRVQVQSNLPKGTAFTRMAMAIARGKGDTYSTLEHAKAWKDTPEVEIMVKAAIAALTTTDATMAAPLAVAQPLVDEFPARCLVESPDCGRCRLTSRCHRRRLAAPMRGSARGSPSR
jgi:hypothetical protein